MSKIIIAIIVVAIVGVGYVLLKQPNEENGTVVMEETDKQSEQKQEMMEEQDQIENEVNEMKVNKY